MLKFLLLRQFPQCDRKMALPFRPLRLLFSLSFSVDGLFKFLGRFLDENFVFFSLYKIDSREMSNLTRKQESFSCTGSKFAK